MGPRGAAAVQAKMRGDVVLALRTGEALGLVQGKRGLIVDVDQKRHAVRPVFLNRC